MTKHVCVINWKGGCGKTTIATHLAVALASSGLETGLADYDRQETAKVWEKLRPKDAVAVSLINWRRISAGVPTLFSASLSTARPP
jgi:chromosome partitioning protein